ncbi:hypothetical protein VTL71DRAFT_847 [Oculimacula yallundae]|uniref:SAP domain-containing protein n=1 Tax=Oculimacula yallundae TaxID=86028 RepID=A0ABR4D3I6_9HELO
MPTKHNFSPESKIRTSLTKAVLANRLREYDISCNGLKENLQVRLTVAELKLCQVDPDTEQMLVGWFSLRRPELQKICRDRGLEENDEIPCLRRALIWDLHQQGELYSESDEEEEEEEEGEDLQSEEEVEVKPLKSKAKIAFKKAVMKTKGRSKATSPLQQIEEESDIQTSAKQEPKNRTRPKAQPVPPVSIKPRTSKAASKKTSGVHVPLDASALERRQKEAQQQDIEMVLQAEFDRVVRLKREGSS